MKFTIEIEPEEFGKMISSFPPEVRQQFIDSAIKAYPMMYAEFMKSAGLTMPNATPTANPLDPFGFWATFSSLQNKN